MVDLVRLRELAERATPGPWTVEWFGNWGEYEIGCGVPDRFGQRRRVVSCGEPAEAEGIEAWDAGYIAAVSPEVLLGLLDRLEAAEHLAARAHHKGRGR